MSWIFAITPTIALYSRLWCGGSSPFLVETPKCVLNYEYPPGRLEEGRVFQAEAREQRNSKWEKT